MLATDAILRILAAGRQAWPGVQVGEAELRTFLDGREDGCEGARGADLVLACACARRDPRAAQLFAAEYGGDLERAAERVRAPGMSAEDTRQMLLHRILAGGEDRPPAIASYSGRGSLRSWVRAVAARAAIDLHRRGGGREVNVGSALFDGLTDAADPELDYLKRHYRGEFRAAFERAVTTLSPGARNQLRHAFVDRLTIDQLASLYGIHRATAARRLAAARDALLEATRAVLIARLNIGQTELDSIMRLIGSRLDVSVQRIFSE